MNISRRRANTSKGRRWAAVVVAPLLVLTACTGGGGGDAEGGGDGGNGEPAAGGGDLQFAVVTHANPGDPFWSIVKAGVDDAAEKYGVSVNYQGSADPLEQAQLVQSAVDQQVDGLVVSMASPDALEGPVSDAANAGIPVIVINAGLEAWEGVGALTYVGQTNLLAGQTTGERLNQAGVQKMVCVIHEAGNVSLDERCRGAEETFGGQTERLQVDVNNLADATSQIEALLASDESIDAVLTLNPAVAISARDAIVNVGAEDRVTLATFDLSGDVIEAIQDDEILFAVDQQPYLQGYLPISFLWLYDYNLNTVGGGEPVLTGPGFVTKENAEQVAEYADRGTR